MRQLHESADGCARCSQHYDGKCDLRGDERVERAGVAAASSNLSSNGLHHARNIRSRDTECRQQPEEESAYYSERSREREYRRIDADNEFVHEDIGKQAKDELCHVIRERDAEQGSADGQHQRFDKD